MDNQTLYRESYDIFISCYDLDKLICCTLYYHLMSPHFIVHHQHCDHIDITSIVTSFYCTSLNVMFIGVGMESTRGVGKFATAKAVQKGGPILVMVVVAVVVYGLEEWCYLSFKIIILFPEVVIFWSGVQSSPSKWVFESACRPHRRRRPFEVRPGILKWSRF